MFVGSGFGFVDSGFGSGFGVRVSTKPKTETTNIKPKSTDLKPLSHKPETLIRKHQAQPASLTRPNPSHQSSLAYTAQTLIHTPKPFTPKLASLYRAEL